MDPHPEVSWCWRRKRERELTFTEATIRSGNRVKTTENGYDSGTVRAVGKFLGGPEGRCVRHLTSSCEREFGTAKRGSQLGRGLH